MITCTEWKDICFSMVNLHCFYSLFILVISLSGNKKKRDELSKCSLYMESTTIFNSLQKILHKTVSPKKKVYVYRKYISEYEQKWGVVYKVYRIKVWKLQLFKISFYWKMRQFFQFYKTYKE